MYKTDDRKEEKLQIIGDGTVERSWGAGGKRAEKNEPL